MRALVNIADDTPDIPGMVTEIGLRIPTDLPEEQFFAIGRALSRFERGMQWAIGDWYNAIPWGNKKAACEQAEINYDSASKYAKVCSLFQKSRRRRFIPFSHYAEVKLDALTQEQRDDLLGQAAQKKWSKANLRRECYKLLGKPERVPVQNFDDKVQHVIEQLPASASKKVKREVQAVLEQLKHDFQDSVEREVNKRLAAQREQLNALEQEARADRDAASKMLAGITACMTEEEYNLIRGLLHPDRHPGEDQERYSKAFEIFKRLKEMIDPYIPVKVLRARGWT